MATEIFQRDLVHDRAIRLFTYLKELSELRTKTIRTLDSYETIVWLTDLPHEPGCYSASWFAPDGDEHADVWVEIAKPAPALTPPSPSAVLEPWLDPEQVADSTLEFPVLRDRIELPVDTVAEPPDDNTDEVEEVDVHLLADHQEIQDLWEQYVQAAWWPWAEVDRRRRAVQAIYSDLFSIYQRQQRLGEQYEVILALGVLNWKTTHGQIVRRHLVTAQTDLAFDPIRGSITVSPAGEGAKPTLEQDMLEADERPDAAEQGTIAQQLSDLGDDIWQRDRLGSLLSSWVHAVSPRGRYEDEPASTAIATDDPIVQLAPALILRRRTERSLIRTFQDIIDLLEVGTDVPLGVRRLIDVVDDAEFGDLDDRDKEHVGTLVSDVYFPLPANDEQREIVNRLQTRQGVLVQGPPGTGKSHTIANLVSHLLATGQRVLVTSHTPRALRVLQEKIPDAVAPLCVSLLGDDRGALQSLEDSVHGITDRFNYWDSRRNEREIDELAQQLDEARRSEALALSDLLGIREAETYARELPFGGYTGTAEAIARRVAREAPQYSWIGIRPDEKQAPPLSDAEACELLHLFRDLPAERLTELRQRFIASTDLVSPNEFSSLAQIENEAHDRAEASRRYREHPAFADLIQAGAEQRAELRKRLEDLYRASMPLIQHPESWVGQAVNQVLAGRVAVWRQLRDVTVEHLSGIEDDEGRIPDRRVVGIDGRDHGALRADATALLQHLRTGKGLGFGPFRPEPVKRADYLLETVTVDGRRCNQPQVLQDLVAWTDQANHLNSLRRDWEAYTGQPVGSVVVQTAAFRDQLNLLDQALAVGGHVAGVRDAIAGIPGLQDSCWYDLTDVKALIEVIDAAVSEVALESAREPLDALVSRLRAEASQRNAHNAANRLMDAVEDRDPRAYADAYEVIQLLEKGQRDLAARETLLRRLEIAAAPLADALVSTASDPSWDANVASIEAAWNWARADQWLARLHDPKELEQRSRDVRSHRERVNTVMGNLAAAKAWQHCFKRMTDAERMHLMAWMTAMRRIGKGTGKYAPQHRRAAREHMDECRSAIPAWIMPIYRVAETVRPGQDAFDVVIVDEASQSGPEALFLQFIAKQIVVVGDDKQISPEFVGISREEVDALRMRHVRDLPFQDALGLDNSFFDQAVIRFGGRIRLREHFRCMPEIIQFSNNLAYQSEPLVPLRQYGADRLRPLKVVHVPDGYRQGNERNVVNPPEAQAIVEQIVACCVDSAYDEKSMGVISLQGDGQARLIESLLLDTLGPEEIERRRLVCGDAYAFQGDERDVMFLSLVAAPTEGRRIGTLSSARDERRFNVAASRARDQAWLFHTATLNDLSPQCLRYQMLEYYRNPKVEPIGGLEEVHPTDKLVEPFDSLFEQHVFHEIQKRGYRVRPQVEVAGYSIDLVVEGLRGRLAVECDGERWHGADRYEYDMARQRQLERCGWTFWRVRGGAFYRDPQEAMRGLWETLDRLQIYPSAEAETAALNEGDDDASHIEVVRDESDGLHSAPVDVNGHLQGDAGTTAVVEDRGGDLSRVSASTRTDDVLKLLPYVEWEARVLPDPRSVTDQEVLATLMEIIEAEGPIQCRRAYRLYADAADIDGIDPRTRSVLNKAVFRGVQKKQLADRDETGTPGQIDRIVRLTGQPSVLIRERGPRLLEEIPPSEIAAALQILAQCYKRSLTEDASTLFEKLLGHYGAKGPLHGEWQTKLLERALVIALTSERQDLPQTQLPFPQQAHN